MNGQIRVMLAALLILGLTATLSSSAPAVEYRLRLASLHEESFVSQLRMGELRDGATGPGLDQLEARLDRGDIPEGAMLFDRPLQPAPEAVARAHRGVPVRAQVRFGGSLGNLWDEVRWEGTPGEHSVWMVTPSGRQPQEVRRIALRGPGPLRQVQPYSVALFSRPELAINLPLGLVRQAERRGDVWSRYVAKSLSLDQGVGVVVAVNDDQQFADHVYLYVRHGEQPTTYKVVLAWRKRDSDREAPSFRTSRHVH